MPSNKLHPTTDARAKRAALRAARQAGLWFAGTKPHIWHLEDVLSPIIAAEYADLRWELDTIRKQSDAYRDDAATATTLADALAGLCLSVEQRWVHSYDEKCADARKALRAHHGEDTDDDTQP